MNESNIIIIQPVNNGFVVTLPFKFGNEQFEVIDYALEATGQKDKMLSPPKETNTKTEHVFIFDTMEKVLAFLADRYV